MSNTHLPLADKQDGELKPHGDELANAVQSGAAPSQTKTQPGQSDRPKKEEE